MCCTHLRSPEKKIQMWEKQGYLLRLKRDLYIVNPEYFDKPIDTRLCANHLYGPSYVSVQWALRYYGMIPELVHMMTSVTTKRTCLFSTPLGYFRYMHVRPSYFPIGVDYFYENGVGFMMATREKALCDTILYDRYVPNKSVRSLLIYLEEDMRLDMDVLPELDTEIIEACAETGCKTQILKNLIKIIKQ